MINQNPEHRFYGQTDQSNSLIAIRNHFRPSSVRLTFGPLCQLDGRESFFNTRPSKVRHRISVWIRLQSIRFSRNLLFHFISANELIFQIRRWYRTVFFETLISIEKIFFSLLRVLAISTDTRGRAAALRRGTRKLLFGE